jgi:hypothetical protein
LFDPGVIGVTLARVPHELLNIKREPRQRYDNAEISNPYRRNFISAAIPNGESGRDDKAPNQGSQVTAISIILYLFMMLSNSFSRAVC